MKIPFAEYVAIPWWDGQQWLVRVEDYNEVHRGDTVAERLAQVGPNASVVVGALFGCDPSIVQVSVEPRLPKEIEYPLQVAEGHVADAARDVEAVVVALRQANMAGHDIAAVLSERALQAGPRRPLLVPNSEIATYGLGQRPAVLAVEWADADVVLTCCRACVETDVRPWQERPNAASAAVYNGPGRCDICGHDVAGTARDRVQEANQ